MSQPKFISRFSPNRTDPEYLERIHVQREDLLANAVELLKESALTANKHHLLFVGPRGCGKTHLLSLIFHRLQKSPELADALRIAWLNEDETSISFLDLLVRVYRALSNRYPEEFPQQELESLYGSDPEQARYELEKRLVARAGAQTVLVMVENLDGLFGQFEETEQKKWRAFIQNHPVFATAGTAQGLFEGVSKRDLPFFGFFDTRHLKPLTVEEATELLERIARLNKNDDLVAFLSTPRGRARVHAIHHLAGGNHRLYIVLSDFITREALDELVGPFEEMVDQQLTPYYQERLRWISAQQRKIVEFLCFQKQPVPVKAIAERLFASHSTITSQLKHLRGLGYVISHSRGRESLYELAEPLMRLSMQVKERHEPLGLLIDFLRVWYEREQLEAYLDGVSAEAPCRNPELSDAVVASLSKGGISRLASVDKIREVLKIYQGKELLPALGDSLVRYLSLIGSGDFNADAAAFWLECWQEAAAGCAEIQLPLRLFSAGINYLKSKDDGGLFELPLEERDLVRQALGLVPKSRNQDNKAPME